MGMVEVVVIGAGPYGLVAAAHLRAAGLEPMVFGEVMGFWKALPKGMMLRSEWLAAHLTDPANPRSLFDYEIASNQQLPRRLSMTEWTRYGEWFQRESVPDVDPRLVESVEPAPSGFLVRLADGATVTTKRVIVATGLTNAARKPAFAAHLPAELATHTADARDYSWLAGKNVAIVGCGQSALEASALLRDVDAQVEIITRQPVIRWLGVDVGNHRQRSLMQKVLRPPSALGPIGVNWIVQIPELFRALPELAKPVIFARAARPAAAAWLRDQVNGVIYSLEESIDSVTIHGDKLQLALAGGGRREVDHLILGSGYDVNLSTYRFLGPELTSGIGLRNNQPDLNSGFESSVPGLHFIGYASMQSFGPLLHSVAGTAYAGKMIARAIKKAAVSRRFTLEPLALPSMQGVSISRGHGH